MNAPVDGLDLTALDRLDRIGGREFVVEMIDLFLEHAPYRIEAARAGLGRADSRELYRAAHSLKSTSANVGAWQLQELAARLEALAAAGGGGDAEWLVGEVEECYSQVRGRLESERKRRSPPEDQTKGLP
jgi:HPt (histidine-containing phosphotransfer) domain-containing protein